MAGLRVLFASCLFVVVTDGSPAFDFFNPIKSIKNLFTNDPETKMTAAEVVRYHGYPLEEHTVTTEDGYILTIQHIPHGKTNKNDTTSRRPVFIQHGILASSTCWIVNTPDKNLPYLLADRGYDVWMGNFRGTENGKRHVTLSPKSEEFWLFSFDEMAKYDLPAMIDFVLNKTGFEKLDYVGHSMGVTTSLVLLSTKTDYNKKIRSLNGLAPVARLDHQKSQLIKMALPFSDLLSLTKFIGSYEYPPKSFIPNILGFDSRQMNYSRIPVYLHFLPAGTSVQTVHHFTQIAKSKSFSAYDYGGIRKNVQAYNQSIPPEYDLTKITAPVYLYWSDNDYLATPEDVPFIRNSVRNLKLDYHVPFSSFNHVDFLWAIDVIPLLYNKLFESLRQS